MLSRRTLIGKAAVGAAAAVAASAAGTAVASRRVPRTATNEFDGDRRHDDGPPPKAAEPPAEMEAVASPPPWALLSPLGAGSAVAPGWQLVDLGPVRDGSCVVTLQNARGRAQRVHLCRNDGAPQGLVYTRRCDLLVMNEGHGDLPTDESLGQAVAALAHVVAANEATAGGVLAELLPHAERVQRFASAEGKLR